MRRAIPALFLTAAVTLGPSRTAVSARPATHLESRVRHVLLRAIGVPAARVEVEATDGVVSLRGQLPDRDASRLAVEAARGVPGVRRVVDLLGA
mgnify:CR=1 FL=1